MTVAATITATVSQQDASKAIQTLTKGGKPGPRTNHVYKPAFKNAIGCIIPDQPNNKDKRPAMKIGGVSHRISYLVLVADGRANDLLLVDRASEETSDPCEISHLCHNSRCINKDHLIAEVRSTNRWRSVCMGHTKTKCGDCGKVTNPCPHTPKCILPEPEDVALAKELFQINMAQDDSIKKRKKLKKDEESQPDFKSNINNIKADSDDEKD